MVDIIKQLKSKSMVEVVARAINGAQPRGIPYSDLKPCKKMAQAALSAIVEKLNMGGSTCYAGVEAIDASGDAVLPPATISYQQKAINAWRIYQDNPRPETRNDFLRAYSDFFSSMGDASTRKDEEITGETVSATTASDSTASPAKQPSVDGWKPMSEYVERPYSGYCPIVLVGWYMEAAGGYDAGIWHYGCGYLSNGLWIDKSDRKPWPEQPTHFYMVCQDTRQHFAEKETV